MHDDPRPGSIPAAAAALTACLAAVDRVIEQNDGHVAAGVDWHALRGSILRGRAALAAPTVLLRRLAALVQGCCHDGDVVQIDGDMLRIGDLLDEADALLAPTSPAPQEESK